MEIAVSPRIVPAEPPYSDLVQQTFDRLMPPGVPPLVLFTTLARSERAFSKFMAAGLLDKGPLGMREREIMIHRTCARTGSEYEWGVHVALFSERVGFSRAHIAATTAPGVAPVWTAREALVVRLADALHEAATIEAGLWSEVASEFSEAEILELIMLAGFYRTVAYLTNGLDLPLETYAARFPATGE
jgi:alkylhydroperoxidase family enzyme